MKKKTNEFNLKDKSMAESKRFIAFLIGVISVIILGIFKAAAAAYMPIVYLVAVYISGQSVTDSIKAKFTKDIVGTDPRTSRRPKPSGRFAHRDEEGED